jgi:very-short-patch-repair endonuclease
LGVTVLGRIHNKKCLKEIRRNLRKALTPAEAVLWKNLQRSQVNGKKFRRQHSIGKYVVDFYCAECRVAVELDGHGHFDSWKAGYDSARTEYLDQLHIRVLRFENRQVFEDLESVLAVIKRATVTMLDPVQEMSTSAHG